MRTSRGLLAGFIAAPASLALGLLPSDAHVAPTPTRTPSSLTASYRCSGPTMTLFDDTNGRAVSNWGTTPTFTTKGVTYCLAQLVTYHWNGGKGATPGAIALTSPSGAVTGPFKATGSRGQAGARNVNWTANVATSSTPVVLNGAYSCVDSNPTTWSQDSGSGGRGFCRVIVKRAVPTSSAKTSYKCTGGQVTIFDDSNGFAVANGGKPPSFSTKGVAYCLTALDDYHWDNAKGAVPGTISLVSSTGHKVGPFKATASSGQGGAPNVNWWVHVPISTTPTVIDGTYSCVDSSPGTWSSNQESKGKGFCTVYGVKAVATAGKTKPAKGTRTKGTGKPKGTGTASPPKCKAGKLGIVAAPDTGKPPLTVTFALCSPKVVQWRVDFGDGQSKVATGTPPKLLTHTYKNAGYYRPHFTTLSAIGASAASVSTSVSVQVAQLIKLTANPASGPAPLKVTFSLSTTVKNITTWALDFGDGQRSGGAGKPPASIAHTYAKDGSYRATFSVKSGQYALVFSVAAVTVGNGTPPVLSLKANPASGAHPLVVRFSLGSTIPGQVVSWTLIFGDGNRQSGSGRPPSTVSHTYSKVGTYAAFLQVSQQQKYGPVLYVVPRGGLVIRVH